jgi:hypothetical protein
VYVDSLIYAFGWSAFLCRNRFGDILVFILFLSKHHHHRHQGDLEQLVYALRQWQYAAPISSPVPSQLTQQLGEYSQFLGKKNHDYAT